MAKVFYKKIPKKTVAWPETNLTDRRETRGGFAHVDDTECGEMACMIRACEFILLEYVVVIDAIYWITIVGPEK